MKLPKFCFSCGKPLVSKVEVAPNAFDVYTGKARRYRLTKCPDYGVGRYHHHYEVLWLD